MRLFYLLRKNFKLPTNFYIVCSTPCGDAAEDVALTQLLKEEGVADIQSYSKPYVSMNKALWKDLEQRKLVNELTRAFLVYFFGPEDGGLLSSVTNFIAQAGTNPSWRSRTLGQPHREIMSYTLDKWVTAIQTGRLAQSSPSSYFKQVFISEQLQTQKPDSLFYEKIGQQIAGFNEKATSVI